MESEFTKSYNGFSGVSMTAWINIFRHLYADIQAISISRTRERAPIYTMPGYTPKPPVPCGTLIFRKFYHPEPVRIFDIQLMAADNQGKQAVMTISGLEIWEEGKPWDPRNMYEVDTQYTYIAKDIQPWRNVYGETVEIEKGVYE
jgi:hypothetical protein